MPYSHTLLISLPGLNDQIRELREVIELPLTNPELFTRVGIKPPKGTWGQALNCYYEYPKLEMTPII